MQSIPDDEIRIDFVRSSGPGGQNVNKTSTKAQLRWSLFSSTAFTDEQKQLIAQKLMHRLTQDGDVAIDVSEERSQLQNKERAVAMLHELVHEALTPKVPRLSTRPPRAAKQARLDSKRQRGSLKQSRKPVTEE